MSMTLEQFIQKARENEEKKVKITTMNIAGFGEVEFQRPNTSVLLKFQSELTTGYKKEISIDEEQEEQEEQAQKTSTSDIDMLKFAKASSAFIYNTCSMMRTKEIRDMFKKIYPEDIPLELFNVSDVITIAVDIFNKFEGKKEVKEIKEDIKN